MKLTSKIIIITVLLSFVSFSQNINISGTVTDSGGFGIKGAIVQLEKRGYKDTTGADGNFTIGGIVGIINKFNQSFPDIISVTIKNNSLCINLAAKSRFQFTTYTIQGKMISSIIRQLNSGNHSIKLPCTGSGVYFHKIKTGNHELLLKSHSPGDMSFGSAVSIKESSSITTAETAFGQEQIDDVIKSTKPGYLHYRLGITNLDTSGIDIRMISQDEGKVVDVDYNEYHAIRIGNQVWTVENLRTTRYNDYTPIPHVPDSAEWIALKLTAAYCYYDNDSAAYAEKYGVLYNWYTVNTGKLAPDGWHVPTDAEWDTLQNYLIANGYNWDGTTDSNKIAKSMAAKTDWDASDKAGAIGNDLTKNNSTGFSALPCGFRYSIGDFDCQDITAVWWSSTEDNAQSAYFRSLICSYHHLTRNCFFNWNYGFSVRLLRD